MDNFDLDNYKKSWQEQVVSDSYQQKDILDMLNKKSRNNVKYILWISFAEFLLFISLGIYSIFNSSSDDSFMNILLKLGVKTNSEIEANFSHLYFGLRMLSILLTAIFVYCFYIKYKKINVESNLKIFIIQILNFKKIVQSFIIANILLFVLFTSALVGFTIQLLSKQHIVLNHPTLIGLLVGLVLTLVLGILLSLLYFRIVYGIIMSKLNKNLEQLQNLEMEND